MCPVIETERLVLRPPAIEDTPAIAHLIGDFEVSKWLTVVPHPYTLADAEEFVHKIAGPWDRVITHKGEVIGVVGIGDSLGYWLGRPFWGHGYMSEAAGALVGAWFTHSRPGCLRPGLRRPAPRQVQASFAGAEPQENTEKPARLTSGYFTDNAASANVLTKLGFTPDGSEMVHARALDRQMELQRMVLTRADWEARDG